jgi:hypothetical protein
MAPPNTDSAPKPYASESYTPPPIPNLLPSLEVYTPTPPPAEKQQADGRVGPLAPGAIDAPTLPGANIPGGLEGVRTDAFSAPLDLTLDVRSQLKRDEKIRFVEFDGQTVPEVRVVGKNGEYLGKDNERGDRITEINFSGNKKSALVGYANDSSRAPNRIDITEKTADGMVSRTSYKQEENGKWGLYVNDRRLTQLPGAVKLAQDGTISHETGDGYWHTERLDGSVLTEKQLAGGARVAVGDDGSIWQVSRPDGSRVEAEKIAGQLATVTEVDAKGQRVTWNNNDGSWTSAQKPGEVRMDMKLYNNGLLSYQTGESRTHVLGNGNEIKESSASDSIKFDEHGRLKAITYPNGDTRSVVFEEGSDKVKSMSYSVKKTGETHEYTRIGSEEKFDYKLTDASGRQKTGKWNGSIEFSPDGTFTTRDGEGNGRKVDGFSRKVPTDGQTYWEKKNSDGSTLICDQNKELKALIRPDNSKVECQREGGQIIKVAEVRPDGSKIDFNYDATTKSWSCDNANIPISKNAPVDADGNLKFKTADGSLHAVGTNGKERIVTRDGATLENNEKGDLEKIVQRNGDYRVINREGDHVVGFTDYDKAGAVKRELKGVSNLNLDNNGDVKYVDANGSTVIEKSNFSRVENDAAGRISEVTTPDGSHRDFTYDPSTGELVKISDVTKSDKGERSDDWTRKRNSGPPISDGKFTDTFERLRPQDGRTVESRTDVKLDSGGDYTYKDSKGRERESRVSERFRRSGEGFTSATIEEAHYNFLDEMRMNVKDDSKMERLELMMNGFEKRLGDQVELRVAAGESEDTVREKMEAQVAATYDHLTRMVQADSSAIDDKATRVMLAETFMYHAWEPETVNQQGWGSCWLQSGYIPCGLGKHPDDMAKVLADVSLTGKYTDRKGNHYDFKRDQLGIHSRADGAGWSIQTATKDNSQPSPVAHRLDRTLSVMDRGAGYGGAGNSGRIRSGGGGQREIMRRVTGDELLYIGAYPNSRKERQAMLEAGGAQRSGGPGHVATLAMRKIGDTWAIVRGDQYDGRDRVISVIRDLKKWKETGESARIERSFAPEWNKEFKIADSVKPSDFRPGPNRPNRPDDDDTPVRPIRRFFRRFR